MALKKYPDLLKPVFVEIDKNIELTLDDYVNNNDPVMEYALKLFSIK